MIDDLLVISYLETTAIGQCVLKFVRVNGLLLLWIAREIARSFLNRSHDLKFGSSFEIYTFFAQQQP